MARKQKKNSDIEKEIKKIVGKRVKVNELVKKHTTFRVGGPVDYLIKVTGVEELRGIVCLLDRNNIGCKIIGMGSNILVKDKGLSGALLKLEGTFDRIQVIGEKVIVGAGVPLPVLIKKCVDYGLQGTEFLSGIPGTVGGAIVMNAGTGKQAIGDLIEEVEIFQQNGKINLLHKKELTFGYRKNNFLKKDIILKTKLSLKKGNKNDILSMIKNNLQKRVQTQPLNFSNAGCIFKNPGKKNRLTAGGLIERAGLKGIKKGKAQISTKHANFIVNLKGAQARDILFLINKIKREVNKMFGIKLRMEIEVWE
ncbi:UDP-N-acetylmuramate dehydrogenase [bacterium]|nr:UDP-N-acetylmuramate dehydrogenase [bacterium]